ncbi:hypothetical protein [Actinoallomurus rhizosphaericola]|uniref:hypothetical protein n=1 Tax=Actinoallomurus rhizosphaericola TaxID=2952536 RepID=UPI002092143B|nr:hypothetical protein [Actinoallomurus rhizosphaericola]MCO5998479.1 hypothetical protein [Actinoallomurus rhizosphaericola]
MLLALSGCGGGTKNKPEAQPPAAGAPAAPGATGQGAYGQTATPAACPTKRERHFVKTRFLTNAGLAAGTFRRYIYKPFRAGAFNSGAPKRKRSIIKAGAAAVFAFDQLRRARANAQADPTLCKVLIGPIDKLSASMKDLSGKLKGGTVDPTEITSVAGGVDGFHKDAASAGAGFQDKNPPASAVGG